MTASATGAIPSADEDILPIRVGFVDDHAIVRNSFRAWLSLHANFVFAGEARSGKEAIQLVQSTPIDVLVLDVMMPGMSGLDALATIRAKTPSVAILIFSAYPEERHGPKLIRHGASGFISKSCDLSELATAIRCVSQGKHYLSDQLVARIAASKQSEPPALHDHLTRREFQIFLKLAAGARPAEIAAELNLTAKTVTMYRTRVVKKLALATNSDLTYYAIKHDLAS
ncbi:MAG: DNA-binding response regulator [Variovorax sp.]|nr:DNA-binding response regulator [Variovorax sp.]